MSDSNYAKVVQWRKMHEVVDDAWLEDCLSDDDVEVPGGDAFPEEGEIDAGEPLCEQQPDRWTDLELETVVGDTPLRQ